ncbi:MAG: OmpA family protein [Alphaproteobacteria bacterium]|nr:OmpA family protein [Alphaproteobacteria bacterium]
MMRTPLLAGLLCAIAIPATAEHRPATSTIESFCKTTAALTPCTLAHTGPAIHAITGRQPQFDALWQSEDSDTGLANAKNPEVVRTAEAKTEPGVAAALQEYIQELLGFKKTTQKNDKKPAPAAADKPDSSEIDAASVSALTAPNTGDLEGFLKQRATWGTRPSGSTDTAAAPAKSVSPEVSGGIADLTAGATGNLAGFLSLRETWGTGTAKPVAAPLAKGAPAKFAKTQAPAAKTTPAKPIVNEAQSRPLPKVTEPKKSDISTALAALLKERQSWGTGPSPDGATTASPTSASSSSSSTSTSNVMLTLGAASVGDYLSTRDNWGKGPSAKKVEAPLANGAPSRIALNSEGLSKAGPTAKTIVHPFVAEPLPNPKQVSQAEIVRARNALLKEREAWGSGPSLGRHKVAGSLDSLFKRRERWGKGPKAEVVRAPLAAGAPRKLKLAKAGAAAKPAKPPIVNEYEAPALPTLTAVPPGKISTALQSLLTEREGWGKAPSWSGPRFAGDLKRYFARRDSWGKGPKAKVVRAPLAAGAPRKLKLAKAGAAAKPAKPPIVNEYEAPALPLLTAVPPGEISTALKSLLTERESWGTQPKYTDPIVAGDLTAYLARRDRWGKGPKAKKIRAPLAAGAPKKLGKSKSKVAAGNAKPAIVNELEDRPLPVVGDISPGQIGSALTALLAEREGWGTEPKISGLVLAGDLNRLFSRRESWGKGPKPKRVRAPLAAGASKKLRLAKTRNLRRNAKPPIVNEYEAPARPNLTPVPKGEITSQLKALFAERASWGTKPVMSTASASPATSAPAASAATSTTDLAGYLAARDAWNNPSSGEANKRVAAVAKPDTANDAARGRCNDDLAKLAAKRRILFETASSELAASSSKILDQIASTIADCGSLSVRIEGHTDNQGSEAFNQKLSQSRANAVLEYLAKAGIERSRLSAEGFGEAKPIASNKTKKSRAKNRRIEFKIQ